jgi:hypothetical protein
MSVHFIISAKEIENQIETFKLKFSSVRDPEIEWHLRLPMFVDTFQKFVRENNRVPSQEEFIDKYFEFNSDELGKTITSSRQRFGLEARLRRTYPSLIRDFHLEALFAEKGFTAAYDRDTDVKSGVDHVFKYKGILFNVHSYVGTSRGHFGRAIKNNRHEFNGIHLDLILNLDDPKTKKVGDFFLYSDNEINRLIIEMEKEISKKVDL